MFAKINVVKSGDVFESAMKIAGELVEQSDKIEAEAKYQTEEVRIEMKRKAEKFRIRVYQACTKTVCMFFRIIEKREKKLKREREESRLAELEEKAKKGELTAKEEKELIDLIIIRKKRRKRQGQCKAFSTRHYFFVPIYRLSYQLLTMYNYIQCRDDLTYKAIDHQEDLLELEDNEPSWFQEEEREEALQYYFPFFSDKHQNYLRRINAAFQEEKEKISFSLKMKQRKRKEDFDRFLYDKEPEEELSSVYEDDVGQKQEAMCEWDKELEQESSSENEAKQEQEFVAKPKNKEELEQEEAEKTKKKEKKNAKTLARIGTMRCRTLFEIAKRFAEEIKGQTEIKRMNVYVGVLKLVCMILLQKMYIKEQEERRKLKKTEYDAEDDTEYNVFEKTIYTGKYFILQEIGNIKNIIKKLHLFLKCRNPSLSIPKIQNKLLKLATGENPDVIRRQQRFITFCHYLNRKHEDLIERINDLFEEEQEMIRAIIKKQGQEREKEKEKESELRRKQKFEEEREMIRAIRQGPVRELAREPARELAREPARELAREPVREIVKEPVREIVRELYDAHDMPKAEINESVRELARELYDAHDMSKAEIKKEPAPQPNDVSKEEREDPEPVTEKKEEPNDVSRAEEGAPEPASEKKEGQNDVSKEEGGDPESEPESDENKEGQEQDPAPATEDKEEQESASGSESEEKSNGVPKNKKQKREDIDMSTGTEPKSVSATQTPVVVTEQRAEVSASATETQEAGELNNKDRGTDSTLVFDKVKESVVLDLKSTCILTEETKPDVDEVGQKARTEEYAKQEVGGAQEQERTKKEGAPVDQGQKPVSTSNHREKKKEPVSMTKNNKNKKKEQITKINYKIPLLLGVVCVLGVLLYMIAKSN